MSRNVALLITATIWPATLALFGAQALRGVGPISGNVFVWCALIGFAVGVAVYGHGWRGMHLVAGLSVPNVQGHERLLSRHRIAGLVSSGAGVGALAVPLVTWMVGNATGIGLASQLAAAIVVVASCICCLLLISIGLRAWARYTSRR